MFKKYNCPNCEEKINKNNSFCPNCGKQLREKGKKNYGMIGKNDSIPGKKQITQGKLFGNLNEKMLNKMLGGAMKMLEKEMQKGFSENIPNENKMPKTKVKIMFNGKELKIGQEKMQIQEKPKKISLPKRILKDFSKLKKIEPKTNLKRLGDTIIYEINLPKVTSIDNISVIQLENSIEVKAISKENAYSKLISIGLPITNFIFSNEKLILEMTQRK
jgi:hypothetical protein